MPFCLTNIPAFQPADSLSFLGYVTNPNQIHMDPEKDCAVANWPANDNRKKCSTITCWPISVFTFTLLYTPTSQNTKPVGHNCFMWNSDPAGKNCGWILVQDTAWMKAAVDCHGHFIHIRVIKPGLRKTLWWFQPPTLLHPKQLRPRLHGQQVVGCEKQGPWQAVPSWLGGLWSSLWWETLYPS